MDSNFYRDLIEMADKAKMTLEEIETKPAGKSLNTSPLHALARACIDGDKLEASISRDLGASRKYNFEQAVFFLNMDRGYIHGRGKNRDVDAAIHNIKQMSLELVNETAKREQESSSNRENEQDSEEQTYVNKSRISELRMLHASRRQGTTPDTTRLIRLLEELNHVSTAGCHMATAMLVRAIVDHIPPVFDKSTFQQVADNYSGQQSFKRSMQHLDKSLRNIADAHLHSVMRNSEVLPTKQQVNFSNDLDVLLGEAIRLLKGQQ